MKTLIPILTLLIFLTSCTNQNEEIKEIETQTENIETTSSSNEEVVLSEEKVEEKDEIIFNDDNIKKLEEYLNGKIKFAIDKTPVGGWAGKLLFYYKDNNEVNYKGLIGGKIKFFENKYT